MRYEKICLLTLVFLVLFVPIASAYDLSYYGRDDGGTTLRPYSPSVYWGESCTLGITPSVTAGASGSFTINNRYVSPDDSLIGTSSPPAFGSNITCRTFSEIPGGASLNGFYEGTVNTTYSADVINSWVTIDYDCDFDSDEIFLYYGTWLNDTYGRHPFGYGWEVSNCYQAGGGCSNRLNTEAPNVIDYIVNGYYTSCGTDMRVDTYGEEYHTTNCGAVNRDIDMNYWVAVPFNSMASGYVNITVVGRQGHRYNPAIGGVLAYASQYYLWDSVTNATTDLGTSFPYSGQLSLIPEREYWLFIGTRYHMDNYNCGSGNDWGVVHEYTNYTISVWAYEPAWNCSAWSECTGAIETRLCTDPLGRVADLEQSRTCDVTVLENATLGFEAGTLTTTTYCLPDWNVVTSSLGNLNLWTCEYVPVNTSIERPTNWVITGDHAQFNRNFISMSNEWSSEGSRSLKMWTIPPKEAEAYWTGSAVACSNRTIRFVPTASRNISNTSLSAGFNVSFPAENMRLRFDTKRCDNQVEQHGALRNWWNSTDICPQVCYGNNCSAQPSGEFSWNLLNATSQESLLGWEDHVVLSDNKRRTLEFDLSTLGLLAGENYTIAFSIFQQNYYSTDGNCILLDNVRYDVIAESYVDSILGGECESQCVNYDYYQATQLSNGACLVRREAYSDTCMTGEVAEAISNLEDVCDPEDSNVLLHYNTRIADYEPLNCTYGCEDGHCLTEEEGETVTTEASLYDCLLFCSYLGDFGFVLSIFMIINYFAIAIGFGLTLLVAIATKKEVSPVIGIISMLIVILGAFVSGMYPVEIGLIIILGIIVTVALFFSGKLTGGG